MESNSEHVMLMKEGFLKVSEWDSSKKKYVKTSMPGDFAGIISCWNTPVIIQRGCKAKTLFKMLLDLDLRERALLELLVNSPGRIKNYEDELRNPQKDPCKKEERLVAIEAYSSFEVQDYDEDRPEITRGIHAHGLVRVKNEKGETEEESRAIEFTPVSYMHDVPLRVREKAYFCRSFWKKGEERDVLDGLFKTDRELIKVENEDLYHPLTLGEFFFGIFDELFFFTKPVSRDSKLEDIKKSVSEIEEQYK